MVGLGLLQILVFVSYALFAIVISFIACVDPDGGKLHNRVARFVHAFPEQVVWPVLRRVCGARVQGQLARLSHWLCEEANPILQMLYLLLICGGYGLVVIFAYPHVPCASLDVRHKGFGMVCFAACLTSFVAASTTGPGYIFEDETVAKHAHYPYDNVIFLPYKVCHTARLRKVARSKYCTTTKCHVARFDHYCPWINNAVGEENYRVFLVFLFCHTVLLCYGSSCIYFILHDLIKSQNLYDAKFFDLETGMTMNASNMLVLQYLMTAERTLCGLLVVCAIMAVVVTGFLAYHFWLIKLGQTTNESYKWSALAKARENRRQQVLANESSQRQATDSPCQDPGASNRTHGDPWARRVRRIPSGCRWQALRCSGR